ncbi:MAG TPA: hypothetical protein VN892_07775 [Solirubrobacteraceae bacterium]|nr:hypothetical protein [Solirubrobacteraceae bacterium]
MGLYYQLASQIIASHTSTNDDGVACILRPFPGHLTRAPFAQFTEEPLHRYLWDGSHLFCQFLRYMIETQWFLSAIVRRSRYRSPSGAELLLEKYRPAGSRLDGDLLAGEIGLRWHDLRDASLDALRKAGRSQSNAQKLKPRSPSKTVFRDCITALRDVLKLDEWDKLGGALVNRGYEEEPSLHVVGYSLGGFTAQSVFMSWPFAISSCSTLLSGGALRELSPTAFAHSEEWQTVLHSLRYELDEGMLDNRYGATSKRVAGLDRELFHYIQRTFYEVFEQEYRGSYESRVEAFRQRMLFVVGGNDPIVRPDSVLDSAPAGGMNLLEIGGLGHFIGGNPRGREERQQREFWLPEIGALIGRFSADAAQRHSAMRETVWLDPKLEVDEPPCSAEGKCLDTSGSVIVKRMNDYERLDLSEEGALTGRQFGVLLNDLLARQGEREARGFLLVLRNEIPTILLPSRAIQRRARALYHDDEGIVKYSWEIKARAREFEKMIQTALVLPWNAYNVMRHLDPLHRFPSQAETAVGQIADEVTFRQTWSACRNMLDALDARARGAIRIFDGRQALGIRDLGQRAKELIKYQRETTPRVYVPSLPDCWIWMAPEFLSVERESTLSVSEGMEAIAKAIIKVKKDGSLAEHLQKDHVRVITVSRARYNPRFRGRLVVDPRGVQQVLLHAGLCSAASRDYRTFDLDAGKRGKATARKSSGRSAPAGA